MLEVIGTIVLIGFCATILVLVFQDMKKAEVARKEMEEIQRHFMAAGLAYFSVMNRYVTSISETKNIEEGK